MLKGESLPDAISRLQRRGRELRSELHKIESAPYLSSFAKQQMRAQIEALAMQGAPSVSDLIEHGRKIEFAMQRLQASVYGHEAPTFASTKVPDVLALTCWLHRDALIAALDREIDTEADDAAALSHVDRETKTNTVVRRPAGC